MKVAIYARVSTEEQDTTNQVELCQELCRRMKVEVFRVYIDNAVSGTKESRPAFDELLEDMRHYKFHCIMVTKLDRIGRSLPHVLSLFNEFNKKGVSFISATQNIDTTTASGKLQMQIIGAFAEYERNIISERTKEGMKNAIGVGKRGCDKKPRRKRGGIKSLIFQDNRVVYNGV